MDEIRKIKDILEKYAARSGQSINFQKSGIFYSSNVRRDKQAKILGDARGV